MATCTHLDQIRDVTPSANGCEDCLKSGDTRVHLRECLISGHDGAGVVGDTRRRCAGPSVGWPE